MEAKKLPVAKVLKFAIPSLLGGGAVLNSYENKRRVCFGSFHSV